MIKPLVSVRKLQLYLERKARRFLGGFRSSSSEETLLQEVTAKDVQVERLSERVFYCPDAHEVSDASKGVQEPVPDRREIKLSVEPVAKELDQWILATRAISTPETMASLMQKNPWEVLDQIRPVQYVRRHSNPDMVPLFFEFEGSRFVGWQMQGAMKAMFDLEMRVDDSVGMGDPVQSLGETKEPRIVRSGPVAGSASSAPHVVPMRLSRAERIAAQGLRGGASPKQVLDSLTSRGLKRGVARGLVSELYRDIHRSEESGK